MIDPVQVNGASAQKLPEPGRYRHFKGNEYELLMVACHSETEELLAVYCAVDKPGQIWVRPVEMFAERVYDNGRLKLRFEPAPEASVDQEQGFKLLQPVRAFVKRLSRTDGARGAESRGRSYSRAPSVR